VRKFSVFLTICVLSLTMPTRSDAQNQVSLRLGLSTISGLVGVEYQMGQVSLTGGWFGSNEGYVDYENEGVFGEMETKPILVAGVRYAFKPEGASPYVAAALVTNQTVDEDLEETGSLGNCLDLAVGYKFPLGGSKFDMTAGAGYGVKVSGEGSGVPALDITLGYSF